MNKFFTTTIIILLSTVFSAQAQVKINEMATVNAKVVFDDDGDDGDYIELYNAGATNVNLSGWGLTDNGIWNKWTFPSGSSIGAGGYLIVFADEKNKSTLSNLAQPIPDHWETAIYDTSMWQIFEGTTANPAYNWTNYTFTAPSPWYVGKGGAGFGDGDDSTLISTNANSVYMRKTFTVTNKAQLAAAIISMDFDDGVVFYLNGVKLGDKQLGTTPLNYNTNADNPHEASLYNNSSTPDTFTINFQNLQSLLVNGTNVLAIEAHNVSSTSSDITCRTWLHFGIIPTTTIFNNNANPSWFTPPVFVSLNNYYHTNFKLENNKVIGLYNNAGVPQNLVNTGTTYYGTYFARIPNGGNPCYTTQSTPALSNNTSTCLLGILPPVTYSIPAGSYNTAQTLTLSCATAGASIYYTTNGDEPTTSSNLYVSPLFFNNTQIIKAKAFLTNYISAPATTKTFMINENTTLPVISISCNSADMNNFQTQNYFDVLPPESFGHFEYFAPNQGPLLYESDGGVEQHGRGSSFTSPKPLRITAKYIYGKPEFDFPFFANRNYTKFNTLIFRNGGNDNLNAHIRDYVAQKSLDEINLTNQATKAVALYANGSYLGVYFMKEAQDNFYAQNRLGIDKDSLEMVRKVWTAGSMEAVAGTIDSFAAFKNWIDNADLTIASNYKSALTKVNKNNIIDYFASESYMSNTDWLFNNIKVQSEAKKNRPRKWNYIAWDLEWGFTLNANESQNMVDFINNSGDELQTPFKQLMTNSLFKRDFINRTADLLNTTFKDSNMVELILDTKAEIYNDYHKYLNLTGLDSNNWNGNVQNIINFVTSRPWFMRNHITNWYNVGDTNTITLQVNPPGAGTILISTISPKTYPWTGVYYEGNPVNIQAIPNTGYSFSNWTANGVITNLTVDSFYGIVNTNKTFIANFTTTSTPKSDLVISEINYNSAPFLLSSDWIELYNPGPKAFNASGYNVKNTTSTNAYKLPNNYILQAKQRVVIPSNLKNFRNAYPNVNNYLASSEMALNNNGENISILKPDNITVFKTVTYEDVAPWPLGPDGAGYTLELLNASANQSLASNWFEGCLGGSPGTPFIPCSPLNISSILLEGKAENFSNNLQFIVEADKTSVQNFQIEKSVDNGNTFLAQGQIAFEQNKNTYNWKDVYANEPTAFYRISAIENGNTLYSNTIALSKKQTLQNTIAFPNPTKNNVTIVTNQQQELRVVLENYQGQQVMQTSINGIQGTISLEQLPIGIYICKLTGKGFNEVIKLVKE